MVERERALFLGETLHGVSKAGSAPKKSIWTGLGGQRSMRDFFFYIRTTKMSTTHKESGGDEYKLKGSWRQTKRD